jgi:dipeptidyl aminopeptidase/acylaminoacyl peptidase
MWQSDCFKSLWHRLLPPRFVLVNGMTAALALCLGLVSTILLRAQQCQETAQSQIQDALDKGTNRVLLREVIDDYGEEGKRILVQIAGDVNQTSNRRGQAIQLLGEHRSEAGEKLLLAMLDDPRTVCSVVNPLQGYRDPQLIPKLIAMLDDHRSCGEFVRFSIGSPEKEQKTGVFLSDEVVDALEHITGKHLEQERDLFVIGHRATQPWKDWWSENRGAFQITPSAFLVPERVELHDNYPCSVQKIAVSPDGKKAFSGGKSYDPWVRAWDIETRRQIWMAPAVRDEDTQSAAVSPDSRMLAIGTSSGALKVFDATTGSRLHLLIVGSSVDDVAFSPDGAILAAASDDGEIRLFDTKTWCETKRIDNSDMTVSIAFSPDGSLLAAATFEKARLWDTAGDKELRSFQVQPGKAPKVFADAGERDAQLWRMAWQVAFSPDGRFLATGSSGTVQIWNLSTGQEIFSTRSDGQVGSLHFSPGGQWVVWGNDHDQIVKWNPITKKRSRIKNEFSLGDTAMTPDGKVILSPGAGTEIAIFSLETQRKLGVLVCSKPK